MRLAIRLAILVAALGGLAYGLAAEKHTVRSLKQQPVAGEEQAEVDALEFVEGTTYDRFILRTDGLFDALSLQPAFAQVKDCKT